MNKNEYNGSADLIPAVGYCRYSSEKQTELSVEGQMRAIDSYCSHNGYFIKEWFIDRGFSGKNLNRPDMQRMIKIIESGKADFEYVIFHKLDRFSRNVQDTYRCLESFNANNVTLLSADNTNIEDELVFGIHALLSQRYISNLSKEVMKGLVERGHKALFNGGCCGLGYTIVDGRYEIIESEAIIVRTIFELAANGYGYNKILTILNEKGYKTKRGNPFGKNSLYEILHSEKYKGVYTYNKAPRRNRNGKRNMHASKSESEIIRIPDAIPKIVSEELWNRANVAKSISSKLSTNAKSTYMLSGLLTCGICNAKLSGNRRHGSTKIYNTYRCNKNSNQIVTCNCKEIHSDVLEKFVIDNLINHFFNDDSIIDTIVSQVNEKIKEVTQWEDEEVKYARNSLQGLKISRSNLVEAISQTGFNQTLAEKLESTETQIREYQNIIDKAESEKSGIMVTRKDVEDKIKTLRKELLSTENIEKKKILLQNYIQSVIVDNNTIKATFKVAFNFWIDDGELEICYNHTVIEARKNLQKSA